eukprot:CAMPEP_0203919606 /NCGR_PEP_ID=MMETSP0359-20131031/59993_1 /ASSEMBLY_ACC=CAM_ASM_000338 /TAXON_ID=268821 /ORGANISM="Scrippsiella Hangoei, Strain SHTV-5" /LENGTH=35 /DNA_ID= /DNA_START= /DNA_END= /DNA_ORIENTATION=
MTCPLWGSPHGQEAAQGESGTTAPDHPAIWHPKTQ